MINHSGANEMVTGAIGTYMMWLRQLFISAHGYRIFERIVAGYEVTEWSMVSDGGNAATLDTHPASDFVLKTDYDALAARVAALEGGTT